MFNIQLNYDINQALDLEEWDGNFHTILLYKAMEYLAPDIKNIKDFLYRMGITTIIFHLICSHFLVL